MYITAKGATLSTSAAISNWTISGTIGGTRTGTVKNDVFYSSATEVLAGGAGDDHYYLWSPTATIVEKGGEGIDTVYVYYWGGIILPANVENVYLMSAGANWATGNALNNLMVAGSVATTLDGGAGDDVLVGGVGADVFKVTAGNGSDAIVNFQPGWDTVQLSGYAIKSFDQLKAAANQTGADVTIKLSATESLVLRGVSLASLSATDFNLPMTKPVYADDATVISKAAAAWNWNGWYVINNTWGSSNLTEGKDFSIESAFRKADVTAGATFSWDYPVTTDLTSGIRAYPEVAFGSNPANPMGYDPTDYAHALPVKVSDMVSLKADYDVSFSGHTAGFNVAYDIWLTSTPNGDRSTLTNEIMVWIHKGSFEAYGTLVGTYTVGDLTAKIYHEGTYTAIVFDKDVPSGTLDIADVIHKLQDMGYVKSSEYIGSIELGAEVVSGKGQFTVNNLDLTIATSNADGSITTKVVTGSGTTVTTEAAALYTNPFKAGVENLLSSTGAVVGKITTAIDATGVVTAVTTDAAGKITGSTVSVLDKTSITTQVLDAAGKLLKVDKTVYGTDGSVTVQHLDATWKLVGSDVSIRDANGVTSIQHYDANSIFTGVERIIVSGTSTTTQYYDSAYKLKNADVAIKEANGTTVIQHYDAKFALTGAERVIVSGTSTTKQLYDSAFKFLGADVTVKEANGATSIQHYDSKYAFTGADKSYQGSDGSTITEHFNASWKIVATDIAKLASNGDLNVYHYDAVKALTGIDQTRDLGGGVMNTVNYSSAWKALSASTTGTAGADTLKGASYATTFHGGLGSDKIVCGTGVDTIHFDTAIGQGDVDTIKDFNAASDKFVLSHDIFDSLSTGTLDASAFVTGKTALDASDRIIYDKTTGNLYYDADGTGSAHQPILFGQLETSAQLTAANFIVA